MSEPMPTFLNGVAWETLPPTETTSGDFDADDFHAFFEGMLAEEDAK